MKPAPHVSPVKTCITALTVVVVFVVFGEAGLQFGSWLNLRTPNVSVQGKGDQLVMLIGDSVMGFHDSGSLASKIQKQLERRWPGVYSVINLSYPANSNGRVREMLDGYLQKYNPQIVLFLLGRSDSNLDSSMLAAAREKGSSSPLVTALRSSKVMKLAAFEFSRWRFKVNEIWRNFHSDDSLASMGETPQDLTRTVKMLQKLELENDYGTLWHKLLHLRASSTLSEDKYFSCHINAWLAKIAILLERPEGASYLDEAVSCFAALPKTEERARWRAHVSAMLGAAFARKKDDDTSIRYFKQAIGLNRSDTYALTEMGWLYRRRSDCANAIPLFEAAIRVDPNLKDGILSLYECYKMEKEFSEGPAFLLERSLHAKDPTFLESLARALVAEKTGLILVPTPVDLQKSEKVADRTSYITKLWLYRKQNDTERAKLLFLRGEAFPSDRELRMNAELYKTNIATALSYGAKVIVVNYPNDSDAALIAMVDEFPKDVYFSSLRQVLANSFTQHDLFAMLEDDFLHLTSVGADLSASALTDKIDSVRRAK